MWVHFANGATSTCEKTYLYAGEIGGLLVTVAPGAPVGDYTISLTGNIGDNGTASACRAHSVTSTTMMRIE
jgi:hypothetical protein